MKYADFRPTSIDRHIPVDGREEWIVVPCARNRDSGVHAESDFASALARLGGESDTVEVHRFEHWGSGRFEIILVDPARVAEVEAIKSALEHYPVLDEEDLGRRESEAEERAWADWAARDVRWKLRETFALSDATAEWFTDGRLWDLYQSHTSGTEHTGEGPYFPAGWIDSLERVDLARWVRECRARERAKE